MQELAPERAMIADALDDLGIDAWVYEKHAGARPESHEQTFLSQVKEADLYLGIFWNGYGAYTIDEYKYAKDLRKDCLIYEKRTDIEGKRDPRLKQFLSRLNDTERGHAVKYYDTVEELAELVKKDVPRLLAESYRKSRTLDRPSPPDALTSRDLSTVLKKVKDGWVDNQLRMAAQEPLIPYLDLESLSNLVENRRIMEFRGRKPETVPPGTSLMDLFDEAGNTLLILGAPGSGKSYTMLQMARALIQDVERDPSKPVPVIVNLSTWSEKQLNLSDWLASELKTHFTINSRLVLQWLNDRRLLLLLDGLDEVSETARPNCVAKINQFITDYSVPGIVICCREDEYLQLPNRLNLGGALRLKALSDTQIASFLRQSDADVESLKEAITTDAELLEMARTPLMLSVMVQAYQDAAIEDINPNGLNNKEARRRHIFSKYVDRSFERKYKTVTISRDRTVQVLGWIAEQMNKHSKTVFLIEEMQPSWLNTSRQHLFYALNSRSIGGLLLGLSLGLLYWLMLSIIYGQSATIPLLLGLTGGLVAGLLAGFMDIQSYKHKHSNPNSRLASIGYVILYVLIVGLAEGLLISLFIGIFDAPLIGVIIGLTFGLYFGLNSVNKQLQEDIKTIESLGWSFRKGLQSARNWLPWGACIGILVGGIVWKTFTYEVDPVTIFIYLILAGAISGGLSGLFGLFFGGIKKQVAKKSTLNQGIKQTTSNILFIGGISGLSVGLLVGVFESFNAGLTSGLFIGLLIAFWYGGLDIIQHYLLRALLSVHGHFPLRYRGFMEDTRRLSLIRRVGGGYQFMHRFMLDHLKEEYEEMQAKPAESHLQ